MKYGKMWERRLNKHATSILIGGVFFSFSALMFVSFCSFSCEDPTYAVLHERLQDAQSGGYWNGNNFSPKQAIKAFLAVIVFSAPGNAPQRDLIRETWGSNLPSDVTVWFMIGQGKLSEEEKNNLNRENLLHNDLAFLKNLNDSYNSLTPKLMESFIWLDRKVDFKFVLKTDEDSYVRLDKVTSFLRRQPTSRFYWGFFDGRAPALKSGKWAEEGWVLCDRYLPYALGGGYVISSDLVHYVASNANLLKRFNNEDVSLGLWLGPLDIKRLHDPRFDTEFRSRGCSNSYLVTHKKTNMQMRQLHSNLKTYGRLCTEEEQLWKSYKYNWNVPPSKCCVRNDSSIP